MIRRFASALSLGFRHGRGLAESVRCGLTLASVLELDPAEFARLDIQVLALDFDGVLAAHGQDRPLAQLEGWIEGCVKTLGANRVFLLSNRDCTARNRYLSERFPGLAVLSTSSRKPDPGGLHEIVRLSGCAPASVALLDDRLLTGGLAARAAGCRFVYVETACADFRARPIRESWFFLLRYGERRLLGLKLARPPENRGS